MSVDSWMPDKNLQNAVSSELRSEKIITGSTFTQADLAKMTKLSINYNQPSNLSGLQYASKLSILSVASFGTNNGISDLSPLANLTQLQQLDLNHNNITDISPLAKLTDLHELHLSSNKISDISVLSGLHNLTDLEVGYNSITDLTPLSGLHLLSKLTISGNAALSNLNLLASLTNLQSLRAAYLPALTNITGIKNAVQLSYLELENDNLTDVAALQNISSLTTVKLDSNHISDLSPLSKSFQGTIVSPNNPSAINQTVAIGSQPIDYEGKKVPVVDNSWSVQNSDSTYRFIGTTTLPNQQSISADDFTMRVGDSTPTVDDFKASATDKDGNAIKVSVDLSKADLSTPGTYDVVLTAADGQTKTVKLTVLNVLPIIYPAPEFTFTKEFVKDPTINLGTTFDPITGIYAWTDSTHSTPIPSVDWQISGNVNTNRAGAYTINYTITNAYGRTATLTRTITVAVNGPTESKTSGVVYVINNAGAVLYSDSATSISLGRTLIIATAWKYYGIVKDANGRIIAYNLVGKQYVKASDVSTSPFADRGIFTVRYPKNANWSVAVYDSHLNVLKLIPARSSWLTYGTQTLADGRTYFNLGGNQWVRTDYGYWRAQTN
ncbi:leucine-rich repeat domain-containing protein [Schleiferilactobacillus harbinensis]|uniref:leucine-rich repeat domain-containing protein n=1 Tax=Schleiferilactobacillus harbinensis TaxID=304207 RepID=UPI001AAF1D5E|nr:leucine-rich repeat domain-containing protein [Schleiferilactobacillus harbinensis]MBO3092344.1 leucine-rich repeat domain-containing protein [Schleiferilactobacillus harbinensis]